MQLVFGIKEIKCFFLKKSYFSGMFNFVKYFYQILYKYVRIHIYYTYTYMHNI